MDLVGEDVRTVIPESDLETFELAREYYDDELPSEPLGIDCNLDARCADGSTVPVEVRLEPIETGGDSGDSESQAAVAVVRDATSRRERDRQVETIRAGTRRIMDAESPTEIGDLVASVATDLFGYESSVFRLAKSGQVLEPVAVVGGDRLDLSDRPAYSIDEDNPVIEAYRRGELVCYNDVRDVDDGYDRGTARAGMYVPMGEYGVLSILDRSVGAFDRNDRNLASNLAANAETILDRIQYESELERQIDRLESFASVVSHDLRNPLTVARGRLEDEIETQAGEHHEADRTATLEEVDAALERMETIVDNTLMLARNGQVVGETKSVSVGDLAGNCWNRVGATNAGLDVEEFHVRADPDRLNHVFENLFSNAIQHGGPDVTVEVAPTSDDLGFFVEDDGPGISSIQRERLFEPGVSNADGGTGFGLAIVREVAQAHGWSVAATNGAAGGARFEFGDVDFV